MRAERNPDKILEFADKNILINDVMSVYFPGALEDYLYSDVKTLSSNVCLSLSSGAHYTLDYNNSPFEGLSRIFVYKRILPHIQHQPTTAIGGKILNVTSEKELTFQTKRWGTAVSNIPITEEDVNGIPALLSTEKSVLQQKYDEVRCTGALAIPLGVFNSMMFFLLNEGGFLITSKDTILTEDGWGQKVKKYDYAKYLGIHTHRSYPEYIFIQKPEDSSSRDKLFDGRE